MSQIENEFIDSQETGISDGYDNSSFSSSNPDYIAIATAKFVNNFTTDGITTSFIGSYPFTSPKQNPLLDASGNGKNISIGTFTPDETYVTVPNITIPDSVKNLLAESTVDENGNVVTPEDKLLAEEVKAIADTIQTLVDYGIPEYVYDKDFSTTIQAITDPKERADYIARLYSTDRYQLADEFTLDNPFELPSGYILVGSDVIPPYAPNPNYTQAEYVKQALYTLNNTYTEPASYEMGNELTTQESVECAEPTVAVIPTIDETSLESNDELNDLLADFKEITEEDVDVEEEITKVNISDLTERTIDGHGAFDWLATATLNQLKKSVDMGLVNKSEVKDIYVTGLQQSMQTAASFIIERERTHWANLAQKNQMEIARTQALIAKAELLMFPAKMKLAYAQIDAQLKQIDLLKLQTEIEKLKIPQIVAQTDQIKEQTAVICQQRKQAIEQLAQAEIDRQLKTEQVNTAKVDRDLLEEQVTLARIERELRQKQVDAIKIDNDLKAVQVTSANIANDIQKQQVDIAKGDVKLKAIDIKLRERQVDLTDLEKKAREQNINLTEIDKKLKEQQVHIAEIDKELRQAQVTQTESSTKLQDKQVDLADVQHRESTIKLAIAEEQTVQAKQQTKLLVAQEKQIKAGIQQSERTSEQIRATTLGIMKDLKIKDANLIKMRADLKLQAQQLIREDARTTLVKAQTASQYAQLGLLVEQARINKAQYSDTIEGQPVAGVLGAQIAVNKAQAIGFERDGYYKFYAQLQSGWTAKKTSDIATLSPNSYSALGVDRATNWYASTYFNMPKDTFEMPEGYRDYLTDEELDGTVATPPSTGSKV